MDPRRPKGNSRRQEVSCLLLLASCTLLAVKKFVHRSMLYFGPEETVDIISRHGSFVRLSGSCC